MGKTVQAAALFCVAALFGGVPCALAKSPAPERRFELQRDTFAFSNDTVFAYGIDEAGNLKISLRTTKPDFSHGCFLMVRGVLQFWRFARFEPGHPKLSREEYEKRVRAVFRIPAWFEPSTKPIRFPGYPNLREFSKAYEGLLKENLGNWFATYVRPGNYRLMFGHPRSGQAFVARQIQRDLKAASPPALYLSRFPKMNHAVLVLDAMADGKGNLVLPVYDPNYPSEPAILRYNASRRSFDFDRRWYFPGGQVNAMRIYVSPVQ